MTCAIFADCVAPAFPRQVKASREKKKKKTEQKKKKRKFPKKKKGVFSLDVAERSLSLVNGITLQCLLRFYGPYFFCEERKKQ